MRRSHRHFCRNKDIGCQDSFMCSAGYEEDDCGRHCAAYPEDTFTCDECHEGQCESCGAFVNLAQPHEPDCERETGAEEDDPRGGFMDGFQERQATAQRMKR